MNNKSQLDVEHLEWAIDQRAKIQHTLLALYVYVRDTEPEESWVYTEAIVNSLIAASFSLWRAVFLAEQTRTDASVRQAQRDFLATVISTNAVTFSDDRRNSAWSLGFYMDTASQRVWSAIALTETHIEHFSSRDVAPRPPFRAYGRATTAEAQMLSMSQQCQGSRCARSPGHADTEGL
jgi:hypothetical protein